VTSSSQQALLPVLSASIDEIMEQHNAAAEVWNPHDWIAWADGKNFAFLGGEDWDASQEKGSATIHAAVLALLLTKDNLPSYHRLLAMHCPPASEWRPVVGGWTAEDNRHAIALRDYVVVSRTQDPEDLELRRLHHVMQGYKQNPTALECGVLDVFALLALHELALVTFIDQFLADADDDVLKGILKKIRHDDDVSSQTFAKFLAKAAATDRDAVAAAVDKAVAERQPIGGDVQDFDSQLALLGAYSNADADAAKLRELAGL